MHITGGQVKTIHLITKFKKGGKHKLSRKKKISTVNVFSFFNTSLKSWEQSFCIKATKNSNEKMDGKRVGSIGEEDLAHLILEYLNYKNTPWKL